MNADTQTVENTPTFNPSLGRSGTEPTTRPEESGSSGERPTLIIGDIHGHYDRLEALLMQEGIIGVCPACGGSGDYHTVDGVYSEPLVEMCSRCDGEGIARINWNVEVVLLGDVGHFGETGSPTGDILTWRAAVLWADIILWGNHDRGVFCPQHAFDKMLTNGAVNWVRTGLYEEKVKLAHSSHGWLFTHAGLHSAFRDSRVDEKIKTDPKVFCAWINQLTDPDAKTDDKYLIGAVDAVGRRRGGRAAGGGILWRDINEKLYPGFKQVFGHSADHKEHKIHYCWEGFHSRNPNVSSNPVVGYCVDIGGPKDRGPDACLAGIWLPEERIVEIRL